jgi:hypothetical protein
MCYIRVRVPVRGYVVHSGALATLLGHFFGRCVGPASTTYQPTRFASIQYGFITCWLVSRSGCVIFWIIWLHDGSLWPTMDIWKR